jgi:hypothetical protein
VLRFRSKIFLVQSETKRNEIRVISVSHFVAKISHQLIRFFRFPYLFLLCLASIFFFSLRYFSSFRSRIFLCFRFCFRLFFSLRFAFIFSFCFVSLPYFLFRFKAQKKEVVFPLFCFKIFFSLTLLCYFFLLFCFVLFRYFCFVLLHFLFVLHVKFMFCFKGKQAKQTPLFHFKAKLILLLFRLVSL